ncbi:MAG TPA: hypothetical protein VIM11_20680 [Tepidisphaeraceae bacterium]|jgi:hypothetical protein
MKTSKLLGIVIALQVMLLVGQWVSPSASVARADIPMPNPSERQLAMLDELRTLNGKVDRLIGLLQSGTVEVKMSKSDKK